jgi:hypothetical protein
MRDRGLRPPLLCPKNPSDFLVQGRRSQVAGKKCVVLYGIILYTHTNPKLLGTKSTGEKKC